MREFMKIFENVTNDFSVNDIIEHRLKGMGAEDRTLALDIIETIYNAGASGIGISELMNQLDPMWPNQHEHINGIVKVVRGHLGEYIRAAGDKLVFHMPTSKSDADVDINSPLGQAFQTQMQVTNLISDICRGLGRFSTHDVLTAVAAQCTLPPAVLRELIDHTLNANRTEFKSEGQGMYRYEAPLAPKTSQQNMDFWRELAARGGKPA